ncbi:unnamed protein product [Phytomonas sp. Hart1]|nr:unnamed protein product [Phytomonas sp. Hart1]|eukprot:CCW71774.1 unnamed protein product [Phytomonas sp. isolate Hart1]
MEEAIYRRQQGLLGGASLRSWTGTRPTSPPPLRELLQLLRETNAGTRRDSLGEGNRGVSAKPQWMTIANVARIAEKADNVCVLLKGCIETH